MLDPTVDIFNEADADGNPAGGHVIGTGIQIQWQNGALGRGEERRRPNGAFVETVIEAARRRLEYYQTISDGKFACLENEVSITKLEEVLGLLNKRTQDREARQVEGTHEK